MANDGTTSKARRDFTTTCPRGSCLWCRQGKRVVDLSVTEPCYVMCSMTTSTNGLTVLWGIENRQITKQWPGGLGDKFAHLGLTYLKRTVGKLWGLKVQDANVKFWTRGVSCTWHFSLFLLPSFYFFKTHSRHPTRDTRQPLLLKVLEAVQRLHKRTIELLGIVPIPIQHVVIVRTHGPIVHRHPLHHTIRSKD